MGYFIEYQFLWEKNSRRGENSYTALYQNYLFSEKMPIVYYRINLRTTEVLMSSDDDNGVISWDHGDESSSELGPPIPEEWTLGTQINNKKRGRENETDEKIAKKRKKNKIVEDDYIEFSSDDSGNDSVFGEVPIKDLVIEEPQVEETFEELPNLKQIRLNLGRETLKRTVSAHNEDQLMSNHKGDHDVIMKEPLRQWEIRNGEKFWEKINGKKIVYKKK
jgi:hypothetical protein